MSKGSNPLRFIAVILFTLFAQAQAPSFTAAGFVNAASSVAVNPPAVARGELVTIFGSRLSTSTQFIPLGSPNPTQIPGSQTRVLFGNVAAPLLYVSPSLVNVQVPFELPQGLSTVDVRVMNELGISSAVNIRVIGQDPGVFAVLNASNQSINVGSSVKAGDILSILATGIGDVLPAPASGVPAPLTPVYNSVIAPVATLNGVSVGVTSSALDPGLVGVYVIKIAVPTGITAFTSVTLTASPSVTIGGAGGTTGATGATGASGLNGITGPTGPQGLQGLIGPTGPAGSQGNPGFPGVQGNPGLQGNPGVQGIQGLPGVTGPTGLTWQGGWVGGTGATYKLNDGVSYNGSSYISLANANTNHQPDVSPAFWSLLAQLGGTGPTGTAATITVASTITGAAGSSAAVGASGTVGAVALTFTIPQGIQGITGPAGAQGATGATGATSTIAGPAGPTGPTGTGLPGQAGQAGQAGTTGPTGATGAAGSGNYTSNFPCAGTCTQYGLQVIVSGGSSQTSFAEVQDSATTSSTKVFGIAGPFGAFTTGGFETVSSNTSYTAGQSVPVGTYGQALCQFDNQVVVGDFIVNSAFNGGFCHSAGANVPASNQIIGIALSQNGPSSFGQPFAQSVFLFGGGTYGSSTANGTVAPQIIRTPAASDAPGISNTVTGHTSDALYWNPVSGAQLSSLGPQAMSLSPTSCTPAMSISSYLNGAGGDVTFTLRAATIRAGARVAEAGSAIASCTVSNASATEARTCTATGASPQRPGTLMYIEVSPNGGGGSAMVSFSCK